jgi:integrase
MVKKSFYFEGRRYYISAHTEEEAIEKMVRRKMELEQGKERINRNTLCKDWLERWLTTYKIPSVSKGWARNIQSINESIIVPKIGNLRLKDVKPIHLQEVLNDKSDLSQSYLRKIFVIMQDAFHTAKKNGLIERDPTESVTIPKGKKQQSRRAITPKERHYILKTCEKHRSGLFYKFMLFCGLRPGEVAALQWRNIDTGKALINIDSSLKADGSIGSPKSEAGYRSVPIPSDFLEELKEIRSSNPFDFVCTNAHGERLKPSAVRQQWESFSHQLNIEMGCKTFRGALVPPYPVADDLVPYCLRHTYCTDLQAAGIPINVARELMGHSDISVTAKIYTHSSEESIKDAADALERLNERRKNNIVENEKTVENL